MKFNIRDVDGKEFEVEEIEKPSAKTKDEPLSSTGCDDEGGLTSDEIKALKNLAAVADKLLAGLDKTQDEDIEEEEKIDDAEEEIEEVVDTDTKNEKNESKKTSDSIKKSASAIEKRKLVATDTIEEDTVSSAWAKRYGGNK